MSARPVASGHIANARLMTAARTSRSATRRGPHIGQRVVPGTAYLAFIFFYPSTNLTSNFCLPCVMKNKKRKKQFKENTGALYLLSVETRRRRRGVGEPGGNALKASHRNWSSAFAFSNPGQMASAPEENGECTREAEGKVGGMAPSHATTLGSPVTTRSKQAIGISLPYIYILKSRANGECPRRKRRVRPGGRRGGDFVSFVIANWVLTHLHGRYVTVSEAKRLRIQPTDTRARSVI
jgi:hypothetical protein